jgi:Phage integrase family
MENSRLREAAPTSVNVTVGKRSREYLTDREVERLIEAAKQNRSGHRDATAILVAYRHGLRASELVALRRDDIDLATGRLHVRRAKSGDASVHPISARESLPLHLGTWRAVVSSRISAHGCEGRRSCETYLPRAFAHAAARVRLQARQRWPRHSRHPSLSRPPIDYVHGPLHSLDAVLEGLKSCIKRRQTAAMTNYEASSYGCEVCEQKRLSNSSIAQCGRPPSLSRVELMTLKGRSPKHRGGSHRKNSEVLEALFETIDRSGRAETCRFFLCFGRAGRPMGSWLCRLMARCLGRPFARASLQALRRTRSSHRCRPSLHQFVSARQSPPGPQGRTNVIQKH